MVSSSLVAAAAAVPPTWSVGPFVALLLAIAVLPLIPACEKFWHHNRYKLLVALALSVPVLAWYASAGPDVLGRVAVKTLFHEYLPFMALLAALYTISGGVHLRGDLPAHPATNTAFLGVGALLASLIGTTGAAMLLIRPLLATNAERRHVRHTVIFFIFIVCNIGGCLLPIGDPPLFLGYLMGVPFLWTLKLAGVWAFANALLLAVYYLWDRHAWKRETPRDLGRDETATRSLALLGKVNFLYLAGVVLAVAFLVPGKPLPLVAGFVVPEYLREAVMLALAGLSLATTPRELRKANHFSFAAILEVAALFLGIFLTMQPALDLLHAHGPALGLSRPWQFFWASGGLSSFLDNAPTYVVFFETAKSLAGSPLPADNLLVAISLGSVFMGANTYIGNGPNFMVKAIAEHRGIRMPGFFGYMLYSLAVLIPLFLLVTWLFF